MYQKLFALQEELLEGLANHKRLEILQLLANGELTVNQMVKMLGLAQANLSQHLSILREKGIVKTRRAGKAIYYSLSNPKIIKAFDIIREILFEKMSKDRRFFQRIAKAKRS